MKRKSIWLIGGCVALAAVLCLGFFLFPQFFREEEPEPTFFVRPTEATEEPTHTTEPTEKPTEPESTEPQPTQPEPTEPEPTEPYVSPVDFEGLWAVNPDAYAWLDIPDTPVSYPILQHPEENDYYLYRDIEGKDDRAGSIYTQVQYNSRDFTDPVTLIYGHNMSHGKMFGALVDNIYTSQQGLEDHDQIVIYLPDRELHYTVFATVPFGSYHLLYNYDFTDERTFRLFFQEIMSVRSLQSYYNPGELVFQGDKVIILSTCWSRNLSQRFLICAKLTESIPADGNK